MGNVEKIEAVLRDIVSAIQTARLYSTAHSLFSQAVAKAYGSIQAALEGRGDLTLGIVGDEVAFEKEIFFEASKVMQPFLPYFHSCGIERLVFSSGLVQEELERFLVFLLEPHEVPIAEAQSRLRLLGVQHIQTGKLIVSYDAAAAAPTQGQRRPAQGGKEARDEQFNQFDQPLEAVLSGQALDGLSVRLAVNGIMEGLLRDQRELLKLITVKRYDAGTFTHMVNVSILTMFFSSRLGFERAEVMDIGVAALFHDIGKLYVSRRIINKPGALTGEEFDKIKSHSVLGAQLLLAYVAKLGMLPVVVAFEHHLRYDAQGYPRPMFAHRPHIASFIVSLCDVYDALCQRRSYKNDYPPDMIYRIMIKEKGRLFDPELLGRFFDVIGVWPVGTVVVLSNGAIAIVRDTNDGDPFSPQVEVVSPPEQKSTIDLREAKGTIIIQRALNPYTEAKPYLVSDSS